MEKESRKWLEMGRRHGTTAIGKIRKDGLEECRIELPTKTHGNMIGVYLCNQAQAEPQNVCVYHEEEQVLDKRSRF